MSSKKKILWITIGISVGLMSALFHLVKGSESENSNEYDSPRKFEIVFTPKLSFKYPGTVIENWKWTTEGILAMDLEERQWHLMDRSGKVISQHGVSGTAPWENQHVKNFGIIDSRLMSVDVQARVIKSQTLDERRPEFRKIQTSIWDGVPLNRDSFLLLNDESDKFGLFTASIGSPEVGDVQLLEGHIAHDLPGNVNVSLEGMLLSGEQQHYYVCSRAGLFFIIDGEGRIVSSHQTIDKTTPPEIKERKTGNLVVFERVPDEIVNYAATSGGGLLYVVSQVAYVPTTELRLDIYDRRGVYLFSGEIPNYKENLPVLILKSPSLLYVCYEDQSIVGYELRTSEDKQI